MLFVGDDWAEDHHDVEVQDETGRRLGKARVPEGIVGIARLHELVARFAGEDTEPELCRYPTRTASRESTSSSISGTSPNSSDIPSFFAFFCSSLNRAKALKNERRSP